MKKLFRIFILFVTGIAMVTMLMLFKSQNGFESIVNYTDDVKKQIKQKEIAIRTEQLKKNDKTGDRSLGNYYQEGQCTFYVYEQRLKKNKKMGSTWGDAKHWDDRAKEAGYKVNGQPSEGAILQTDYGDLGHVAIVEEVKNDGSIVVTDMNYEQPYKVTERLITSDRLHNYQFIHEKI
ncbi:CHAP domain-containing protein [Mammaliicoccus sp. Dog046]|uniref:CHAP domain-containing protein n=1 Tax=Mammaliicoccus sp. Dog046 TaxID=3034233 RepID=UPI002B25EF9F|nr:CHAP domain-containing protein [Mammaliicoccus sp. Dog046]WQK85871.1 CHAP domain-containing protein [Mammaliicoccus sp. Dog046]